MSFFRLQPKPQHVNNPTAFELGIPKVQAVPALGPPKIPPAKNNPLSPQFLVRRTRCPTNPTFLATILRGRPGGLQIMLGFRRKARSHRWRHRHTNPLATTHMAGHKHRSNSSLDSDPSNSVANGSNNRHTNPSNRVANGCRSHKTALCRRKTR